MKVAHLAWWEWVIVVPCVVLFVYGAILGPLFSLFYEVWESRSRDQAT